METRQYIRSLNKEILNRAGRLFFFFLSLSRFGKLRVGGEAKREESKKTFQLGLPARAIAIPFSSPLLPPLFPLVERWIWQGHPFRITQASWSLIKTSKEVELKLLLAGCRLISPSWHRFFSFLFPPFFFRCSISTRTPLCTSWSCFRFRFRFVVLSSKIQ